MSRSDEISDGHGLLQRIREGDHLAFTELYDLYAADIMGRIKRLVHDPHLAEELHQDVFLRLWEKRLSLDVGVPPKAILIRTAKSMAIDFFRKAARDNKLREQLIATATELYDHVGDLIDFRETNQFIQQAIAKLPPQRLKIFTCIKIEGNTYEQAAEQFGVSISTVKDHMAKAMQSIKKELFIKPAGLYLIIAGALLCEL